MEDNNQPFFTVKKTLVSATITIIVGMISYYVTTGQAPEVFKKFGKDKKKEYTAIINSYYADLKNKTFDPNKYFASRVKKYFTKYDANSQSINDDIRYYYSDYIDVKLEVYQNSAMLTENNDGTNTITIDISFTCKRPSIKKRQIWSGQQIFVFDEFSKIVALEEVHPYRFSRFEKLTD
jgi:hypothetical protein